MPARFFRTPEIDAERLPDGLLLVHPRSLEVRLLNDTAAVLWEALPSLATAEELAALLCEARPEMTREGALAEVERCLEELAGAGFVARDGSP
jgi:hypothetical protein